MPLDLDIRPPVSAPAVSARYLDRVDDADAFLASLGGLPEIALDTEGASFHRFLDRIYLLQISTREVDAIIDPLAAGPLPGLIALIADPSVEIVLHDADYDLRLLRQDYGVRATRLFDTRVAAQLLGIRAFGLAALLDRYFGVRLEKKYQRADWSLRPLTPGMLEYAVLDTHYLLPLRDRLLEELDSAGRSAWAREEFDRITDDRAFAEREEPAPAFLRMRGTRDLTRRELAVFRELVAWRDETARILDRAAFRVCPPDVLLELARERPKSRNALAAIRILPRVVAQRYWTEILGAVETGENVPESELPRMPRAPRWDKDPGFDDRLNALRNARDFAAERLRLDPGVLCSRDRLEAIARARPTSREELGRVPALRRWQVEVLGEDLLRAL